MNTYPINDFFSRLTDVRRTQGQRHTLNNVLTIVIMAILSGHQGLRGFARFARVNATELSSVLDLKHGVPKFNAFRDILLHLDAQLLADKFIEWVKQVVPTDGDDFISLDGKAITGTSTGGNTQLQTFVSVVNAFGQRSGLVYGMQEFENGKSGEAQALRHLVERLGLTDKVFTMDALHAQKKLLTSSCF